MLGTNVLFGTYVVQYLNLLHAIGSHLGLDTSPRHDQRLMDVPAGPQRDAVVQRRRDTIAMAKHSIVKAKEELRRKDDMIQRADNNLAQLRSFAF